MTKLLVMLSFRPLLPADQAALWNWLHIALWDPPPAPLRPSEVLQNPGVRIYAETVALTTPACAGATT